MHRGRRGTTVVLALLFAGAAAGQQDLIGNLCVGCSYVTYNGLPTIRSKTRLGLQEGSGVMIWELSQDATGNNSLLTAIRD